MAEKSNMTPDWIQRVWQQNPCRVQPNGNVILGPCRAAFVNVLERPKPGPDGKERSYGVVLVIPPLGLIGGAQALAPLQQAIVAIFQEKMPAALANADLMAKMNNPIKRQATWIDKKTGQLYDGFEAGPDRFAISSNSAQSKPAVVDQTLAPIVDKSRLYSGCWVIPAVKPAWITRADNPGVTCYLQSLMVVADDENLGGVGAANPSADFQGVKVDPSVNPSALFGAGGETAGAQPAAPINLFA